jgi:subtilisin family serine protease
MRVSNITLSIIAAGVAATSIAQPIQGQAAQARDFAAKSYMALNPTAKTLPNRVLVRFREKASQNDRASARASVKGLLIRKYSIVPGLELIDSAVGAENMMSALRKNPNVEFVQPDYVRHATATPNDPMFASLWGMDQPNDFDINAPEAWDVFTGVQDTLIGDIDTVIDYNHPDLADNVWTNPNEIPGNGIDDEGNGYVDDVHGWDAINNDGDPMDDHSHGTHVAGTMGGRGDNAVGVAGVNWRCSFIAAKVLDAGGSGSDADIVAGFQYMAQCGAKLSNNSWGGFGLKDGSDAPALYAACQALNDQGHLLMFAAGNSNFDNDSSAYTFIPSSYEFDNLISVAAVDSAGNRSSFSCYGLSSVDLAAPGTGITSTVPGGGYATWNGTSMATPHVAGAAALLWAYHPGLDAADVKSRILGTVKPLTSMAGLCVTGGMLNLQSLIVNGDPTSDAGGDQTIEATGPTTEFTLNGVGSSDPDKDDLFFEWFRGLSVGTGNPLVLSQSIGTYEYELVVTDPHGANSSDTVNITIQDTTDPVLDTLSDINAVATSASGAVVNFSPEAEDLVDGTIAADCTPTSGSTFAPGSTTVNVSASDLSGNTAEGTFKVNVTFSWSGFLSPFPKQQFKKGSNIPIKFQLTGDSASITNLVANATWATVINGIIGPEHPIGPFKYGSGIYTLNWKLGSLAKGTYRIFANFGDGSVRSIDVILK